MLHAGRHKGRENPREDYLFMLFAIVPGSFRMVLIGNRWLFPGDKDRGALKGLSGGHIPATVLFALRITRAGHLRFNRNHNWFFCT